MIFKCVFFQEKILCFLQRKATTSIRAQELTNEKGEIRLGSLRTGRCVKKVSVGLESPHDYRFCEAVEAMGLIQGSPDEHQKGSSPITVQVFLQG